MPTLQTCFWKTIWASEWHRRRRRHSWWSACSTRRSRPLAGLWWCSTWRKSTPSATGSRPPRSFWAPRRTTSSWFGPPTPSRVSYCSQSGSCSSWFPSSRTGSSSLSSPKGARCCTLSRPCGGFTSREGSRISPGIGSGRQLAISYWLLLGSFFSFTLGVRSTISPLILLITLFTTMVYHIISFPV